MKKYVVTTKKQLSTLALGCVLVASTALALVNCTDPVPPATVTVTFDMNGGEPTIESKTVETGTLLTKPSPDPTKTGYTFEGWYKDAGFTQAFNFNADKITANITLYAKWTPESTTTTHTVTFNLNGGAPDQEDKTVEAGKLLAKPATEPTKEGYSFAGWYKDKALTQAFNFATDKISANTTLYAKWATATYTVTFNANGGSNVDQQTVENGKKSLKTHRPHPGRLHLRKLVHRGGSDRAV